MSLLIETFGQLQASKYAEERWLLLNRAFDTLGAAWTTAAFAPRSGLQPLTLRTSLPTALMRDYIGAGLPTRDRWFEHCATSPVIDHVDLVAGVSSSDMMLPEMSEVLRDHGIHFVALVPAGTTDRVDAFVAYAGCRDGADRLRQASAGSELLSLAALFSAFQGTEGALPAQGSYRFRDLLSPRERETLLWLASGLRTAQIADRMGIEPVTVNLHVQGARRKLGARTREHALAIALRDGHILP